MKITLSNLQLFRNPLTLYLDLKVGFQVIKEMKISNFPGNRKVQQNKLVHTDKCGKKWWSNVMKPNKIELEEKTLIIVLRKFLGIMKVFFLERRLVIDSTLPIYEIFEIFSIFYWLWFNFLKLSLSLIKNKVRKKISSFCNENFWPQPNMKNKVK